jgi:ribonuclease D
MASFQFVDTDSALATVIAQLENQPAVALDTEFMREETYYPRLCLIQVATAGAQYVIDPLALTDLDALSALLARSSTHIVLHAARQDVEVLLTRCTQLPSNLFDTQVAAALCGLPPQIGYGDLVQKMLGVELEKAHSRTDWARRPLSEAQLHYAAEDVEHLLALEQRMRDSLERLGRLAWFEAEMQRLQDPALYRTEPENAWQRLKGLDPQDERRLATARALAEWRERRAMNRNRPRGWILADDALHQIVRALPERIEALQELRAVPRGVADRCGKEILAAVAAHRHLPVNPVPARRPPPDAAQQKQLKALAATVKTIAQELGLSPEVLATRRDLQALLNGHTDVPPLQGWRKAVIGEPLLADIQNIRTPVPS